MLEPALKKTHLRRVGGELKLNFPRHGMKRSLRRFSSWRTPQIIHLLEKPNEMRDEPNGRGSGDGFRHARSALTVFPERHGIGLIAFQPDMHRHGINVGCFLPKHRPARLDGDILEFPSMAWVGGTMEGWRRRYTRDGQHHALNGIASVSNGVSIRPITTSAWLDNTGMFQ